MMIEEQRAHAARQQRTRSGHVGQVNDQADGQVGKRRGVIEQTHARANSYSHSCHHAIDQATLNQRSPLIAAFKSGVSNPFVFKR